MVKIINPYNGNANNGIGQSLAQLGQALFGDQVGSDYRRAQLFGKEMENQGRMDVSNIFASGNPDYNALTAAAARAGMSNIGDFERFRSANVYGAESPRTTNAFVGAGGAYGSTYAGTKLAQDTEILKSQMAADRAAAATEAAARLAANNQAAIAERERQRLETQINMEPVTVLDPQNPGGLRTVYRKDVVPNNYVLAPSMDIAKGAQFVGNFKDPRSLVPEQQKALGFLVEPDRAQNWMDPTTRTMGRTFDGKTDASTNRPLAPNAILVAPSGAAGQEGIANLNKPANPVVSGLQQKMINAEGALKLISGIKEIVNRDPTAVGPLGNVKRFAQDAAGVYSSLTGESYDKAVMDARATLLRTSGQNAERVLPGLFNPDLNSLTTLTSLLYYKMAAADGQTGSDVTDKDIMRYAKSVGDPTDWFTSHVSFLGKMNTAERMLSDNLLTYRNILQQQNVNAGAPQQTVTAAPTVRDTGSAMPYSSGANALDDLETRNRKVLRGRIYVQDANGDWYDDGAAQ